MISKLAPGSVAATCGRVQVGDVLTCVDGRAVAKEGVALADVTGVGVVVTGARWRG